MSEETKKRRADFYDSVMAGRMKGQTALMAVLPHHAPDAMFRVRIGRRIRKLGVYGDVMVEKLTDLLVKSGRSA